jgi:hypothetical protein
VIPTVGGCLEVRFYIDPHTNEPLESLSPPATEETPMNEQKFPQGWDAIRVERLIAHYDALDENEHVAADKAARETDGQSVVVVPTDLLPAIRQMIAQKSGN